MGIAIHVTKQKCSVCNKDCTNENSFYYENEKETFMCDECLIPFCNGDTKEGRLWFKKWNEQISRYSISEAIQRSSTPC